MGIRVTNFYNKKTKIKREKGERKNEQKNVN